MADPAGDTAGALSRLDSTLTTVLVRLTAIELQLAAGGNLASDHEQRLRGVERWTLAVPASVVASVVGSLASVGMTLILR